MNPLGFESFPLAATAAFSLAESYPSPAAAFQLTATAISFAAEAFAFAGAAFAFAAADASSRFYDSD